MSATNSNSEPERLLESLKKNDLNTIKTLIESNESLLSHKYLSEDKNILQIACSEEEVNPETIQLLIDLGADLNGCAECKPLHLAAQNPNHLILEVVLKNLSPEKINDPDPDGNNALHSLIKGVEFKNANDEIFCENVKLLLSAGININQGDGKEYSAILLAAKYGYRNIIKTILELKHVDLDNHKLRDRGKSARNLIIEKSLYDGDLPPPLPEITVNSQTSEDQLFSLLKKLKEDDFLEIFKKLENPNVNADDKTSTFLQYGCEKGWTKFVKYLLDKGADVNLGINKKSPLEIVTQHGYFEIFQLLLDYPGLISSPNILCDLIKKVDNPKSEKINDEKCCQILLERLKDKKFREKFILDINGEDALSNTPLHYSLRYADDDTTNILLKLGASLACKNRFESMPIEDIKPEVLENHLDECIEFKIDEDFEVEINYNSLMSPKRVKEEDPENQVDNYDIASESDVIAYMSTAPELRNLLKHPVIVTFLIMKWHRIHWLFFSNLCFCNMFVLSLIAYILTYYGNFDIEEPSEFRLVFGKLSWFTLNLSFWLLILRELFQMTVFGKKYFQNFEKFVEISLIVTTGMILYINSPTHDTRKQLSSIAILLAALELVLMMGVHPIFSTYVVMLKKVSFNFFKLFLLYSLLIIAFALSFSILFAKSNKTDSEEDLFMGFGASLFKTIIMLTGEYDADSINFHRYPMTSKLIFSLFVFMITIILLNLLNGLAVSDIQAIKNYAELVGHISRAQYINNVESVLLLDKNKLPLQYLSFHCDTFFKSLAKKVCVFSNSQNCKLRILLNQKNQNGKICYSQTYKVDSVSERANYFSWFTGNNYNTPCLDKQTVKLIFKKRRNEHSNISQPLLRNQNEP